MLGKKPECGLCHTSEAAIWKKMKNDMVLCNECATNRTTCLPSTQLRKSRSSSPELKSSLQSKATPQKIDHQLNDSSSALDEDMTKKSKDDSSKESSSSAKEDTVVSTQSSKSKVSKEKSKREESQEDKDDNKRDTRRKTRKGKLGSKGTIPKGKGRRYIFKKSVSIYKLVINDYRNFYK